MRPASSGRPPCAIASFTCRSVRSTRLIAREKREGSVRSHAPICPNTLARRLFEGLFVRSRQGDLLLVEVLAQLQHRFVQHHGFIEALSQPVALASGQFPVHAVENSVEGRFLLALCLAPPAFTSIPTMRSPLLLLSCFALFAANAQYGTFDPKTVTAAKAANTVVVLDDANTSYNQALTSAIKADWKFTKAFDFINTADLATQPYRSHEALPDEDQAPGRGKA